MKASRRSTRTVWRRARLQRRFALCSDGVGAWRSPVAHLLWEQGVAGSNPVAPTSTLLRVGFEYVSTPYCVNATRVRTAFENATLLGLVCLTPFARIGV